MIPELSIVIPVRNESPNIKPLYDELTQTLSQYGRSYELLIVDDGSTDDSFEQLAALQARDPLPPQFRADRGVCCRHQACSRPPDRHFRWRSAERSARHSRDGSADRRGQRHRLRLAQGSERYVRDAPHTERAREQVDLVGHRGPAARLWLLVEGVSRRGREAASP